MIPFKVLCLLWQLKGKTLTTEVSSFISSASLHFAVVFYAWTKQKLEPAYSGSDAPHMLGYLTVPLFIFSNENKVTTTSYRDLLGQMTFYLCVRDKEFLFFFFFPFPVLCHQVEGGDFLPLLSSCGTPPAVVHPAQGSPMDEGCECARVSSE